MRPRRHQEILPPGSGYKAFQAVIFFLYIIGSYQIKRSGVDPHYPEKFGGWYKN